MYILCDSNKSTNFYLTPTLWIAMCLLFSVLLRSTHYFLCLVMQSSCLFVTPWTVAHQAPLCMGIFQARTLEWVPMLFSRGSSQPRDRTQVSHIAGRFLTIWATREALLTSVRYQKNHNTLTRKIWMYNNYNLIFFSLTKETCIKELISRVIIVVTNRQQVLVPDSVAKWFMPTGFWKAVFGAIGAAFQTSTWNYTFAFGAP